ncbi:hypothetical protein ACHAXR_005148 [Thalassiosira sp. AJA248-18]
MTRPPNGAPAVALSQSRGKREQPEDADQAIVYTPYGRGPVIRTRKSDGIKEVQLLEWESFAKPAAAIASKRTPCMMYTAVDYPSVIPHVGDDVVCQYGRGRVKQISRVTTTDAKKNEEPPALKYTIALSSWKLNGRSDVTCHVTSPPPRVVRKHTLSEMDAHEKVELAKGQKSKATNFFSQRKDYNLALTTYASAVDAVRNVQHDHTSTNEVRSDLVVVMVTCSNNAATCCIKLEKWDEASKFAKNALILLDALYGKRGMKIHSILNKEGMVDSKLFGEWRVKSYLVVARACVEEGAVSDAMSVLKKARDVAMGYIDEINFKQQQLLSKEEKASLKSLASQVKEIRRRLVECSDKKKATKKMEKRRAKAMFGGDRENASTAKVNKKMESPPEWSKMENNETANTAPTIEPGGDSSPPGTGDQENESPYQRKSSLNANKTHDGSPHPSVRKSVSFSNRPPQVKEIESVAAPGEEDEEAPWYLEHQEALIMIALAGFSGVALMAMRRSFR